MALEIFEEGGFNFKVNVYCLVVLTGLDPLPNPSDSPSSEVKSPAIANTVGRPHSNSIGRPSTQVCGPRLPGRRSSAPP
jgi:hypothetical protein